EYAAECELRVVASPCRSGGIGDVGIVIPSSSCQSANLPNFSPVLLCKAHTGERHRKNKACCQSRKHKNSSLEKADSPRQWGFHGGASCACSGAGGNPVPGRTGRKRRQASCRSCGC